MEHLMNPGSVLLKINKGKGEGLKPFYFEDCTEAPQPQFHSRPSTIYWRN